jgi:hypothetical protein
MSCLLEIYPFPAEPTQLYLTTTHFLVVRIRSSWIPYTQKGRFKTHDHRSRHVLLAQQYFISLWNHKCHKTNVGLNVSIEKSPDRISAPRHFSKMLRMYLKRYHGDILASYYLFLVHTHPTVQRHITYAFKEKSLREWINKNKPNN